MHRRVLVATALLLTACGGSNDDGDEGATEAMVLETCAPDRDPIELDVCECAYQELRDRFDDDAIERLDRELLDDPETVPPEVQEVVLACGFERVSPPTTKPPSTTTTSSSSSTSSTSTTLRRP